MLQQSITYLILSGAVAYVVYRMYSAVKKKQACGKCVLMKAAKDNPKKQFSE
jgi:hypothetical protein